MALMAAGIGAVGSIAGGLLGGSPPKPKYKPYDVTSGMGTVDYDKKGKRINMTLSPEQQAFADQYGEQALQYMQGGPYGQQARGLTESALGQMPGMFGDAMSASQFDPSGTNQYQQLLAQLGGQTGQIGAGYGMLGGQFQNLSGQVGGLGGQFGGLSNQANQYAMQQAQDGMAAGGMARGMFSQGQELMGSMPQSYQDVAASRLDLLRQQAQPYEQRAQNSFLQRQQAMGRMGSTGGQRDIEAFASGQAQADTTRQLDSQNMAETLYGRDQQAALQKMGYGANLMAGGLGGMQNAGAQAQGWMGMGGNFLGQQLGAMNDQSRMFGQFGDTLGAQAALYGQQANFGGAGYSAGMQAQDITNARAQQRMGNAYNLFGFGAGIEKDALSTGVGLHGNQVNMYGQLQNNANLGHQSGAGTAAAQGAAAQTFQPNVFGAALSGFGNAVAANPSGFAGMFGGGQPTVGLTPAQSYGAAYSQIPMFSFGQGMSGGGG